MENGHSPLFFSYNTLYDFVAMPLKGCNLSPETLSLSLAMWFAWINKMQWKWFYTTPMLGRPCSLLLSLLDPCHQENNVGYRWTMRDHVEHRWAIPTEAILDHPDTTDQPTIQTCINKSAKVSQAQSRSTQSYSQPIDS